MFGAVTVRKIVSDLAALMEVKKIVLNFQASQEGERGDEPEQWPRHQPRGNKCQVQTEIILLKKKKCIPLILH